MSNSAPAQNSPDRVKGQLSLEGLTPPQRYEEVVRSDALRQVLALAAGLVPGSSGTADELLDLVDAAAIVCHELAQLL